MTLCDQVRESEVAQEHAAGTRCVATARKKCRMQWRDAIDEHGWDRRLPGVCGVIR